MSTEPDPQTVRDISDASIRAYAAVLIQDYAASLDYLDLAEHMADEDHIGGVHLADLDGPEIDDLQRRILNAAHTAEIATSWPDKRTQDGGDPCAVCYCRGCTQCVNPTPPSEVCFCRKAMRAEAAKPVDEQPQDERDAELPPCVCGDPNCMPYWRPVHEQMNAMRVQADRNAADFTKALLEQIYELRAELDQLKARREDAQDVRDGDVLIGPLSAAEWCAFRLRDDGGELLRCCSVTSQFRDALFDVLRAGAGVDCAPMLRPEWEALVRHGLPDGVPQLEKIRAFYELLTEQEVAALDAREAKGGE